jgi:hypothetical protein
MRTRIALALLALSPSAAHAEDLLETPRERQGYFVGFGGGFATSYAHEGGRDYGPISGTSFNLAFGQLVTERLGLGVIFDFGGGTGDGQEMGTFALSVDGQASLVDNLALHASIGLGVTTLVAPDDDDDETRGIYGATYALALSYDWFFTSRRSGGWSLTPSLAFRVLPTGDDNVYGGFLGVQISWWSGLPKNQLELDVKDAF